jgi:hypothetical protein
MKHGSYFDISGHLDANRGIILLALRAAGVETAIVEYLGVDGEETTHLPRGYGIDRRCARRLPVNVPVPEVAVELRGARVEGDLLGEAEVVQGHLPNAVRLFASVAVNKHYPHWSANDGGEGVVVFDSVERRITIQHRSRTVVFEDSEATL